MYCILLRGTDIALERLALDAPFAARRALEMSVEAEEYYLSVGGGEN